MIKTASTKVGAEVFVSCLTLFVEIFIVLFSTRQGIDGAVVGFRFDGDFFLASILEPDFEAERLFYDVMNDFRQLISSFLSELAARRTRIAPDGFFR